MKRLTLLKQLYSIERFYRDEYKVVSFIINYCYSVLPNQKLKFEIDCYNNLFITKNTSNPEGYACVIAHMDCIQKYLTKRKFIIQNGYIRAVYKNGLSAGLGADDSNGIWVALRLLEEVDNIKVVFTTEEESGGMGAEEASENIDFFSDVRFMIQADRRGSSDLITHTNGIDSASKQFIDDIAHITKKYNYKINSGTFTDVGILSENLLISGVNISCGYHNEHTDKEYTNLESLENCYNYIKEIILYLNDKQDFYTITVPKKSYSKLYHEDEFDCPCNHCRTFDCMNCKFSSTF